MSLSGYSYYRSVTIDHTKCGSSNSSSFTVAFVGTYAWLATVANSGYVQSASGYDIVFSTDQSTILNFERVSWTASTGACEFHVSVATVSHSADTVLYIYYGNSSVTTDQQNASSTWDSHFMLVEHMADNAANTNVVDSTSHGYTGTNAANTSTKSTAAEIGNGLTYNGTTDYTQIGYQANLNTAKFTVSAWVKVSGGSGTYRAIASSRDSSGSNSKGWILYANSNNFFSGWMGINDGGGDWNAATSSSTITNGNWYLVHFTYDGTTGTLYVNGSSVATKTSTYVQNTTYNTRVGAGQNETSAGFFFNGVLDEVRYADTNRSADWITTEYNNQSAPSTFYTIGSQQNNSGGVVHLLICDGYGGVFS